MRSPYRANSEGIQSNAGVACTPTFAFVLHSTFVASVYFEHIVVMALNPATYWQNPASLSSFEQVGITSRPTCAHAPPPSDSLTHAPRFARSPVFQFYGTGPGSRQGRTSVAALKPPRSPPPRSPSSSQTAQQTYEYFDGETLALATQGELVPIT